MKKIVIISLLIVNQISFSQLVSVSKIEENRSNGTSSFSNNIKIELKVSGDEVRKYKSIKLGALLKSTDDQGLDLYKKPTFDYSYKAIDIDGMVEVELQKASRKAVTIKTLEGIINLYNPTIENKGELQIKNFKGRTNENLLPSTFPLKLVYLTKESVIKKKEEMQKKKEEDIKKLPEATRKLAETLVGLFDNLSELSDSKTEITFLLEGNHEKLVDLYFLDKSGEKIERNGYFKSGNMITYPFSKEIENDWIMVINIESDQSIKKTPFKLTNIALP